MNGAVEFAVRVIPRASKSEIVGEHDNALKIKLASPPVDGAANEELVKVLSKFLGVSKGDVEIISGMASKSKRVRVRNLSQSHLEEAIK